MRIIGQVMGARVITAQRTSVIFSSAISQTLQISLRGIAHSLYRPVPRRSVDSSIFVLQFEAECQGDETVRAGVRKAHAIREGGDRGDDDELEARRFAK